MAAPGRPELGGLGGESLGEARQAGAPSSLRGKQPERPIGLHHDDGGLSWNAARQTKANSSNENSVLRPPQRIRDDGGLPTLRP